MDKRKLSAFSIELRKMMVEDNMEAVIQRVKQANLTTDEYDFVFMCLNSNGYDPVSDMFVINESDNSAFLSMVSFLQAATNRKK